MLDSQRDAIHPGPTVPGWVQQVTREIDPARSLFILASKSGGTIEVMSLFAEVHLPIGKPVKALLRSIDVLHDFTVPQFRVKMDLVPGLVTYVWLTPTRTGKFDLLCNELCGIGHFVMRGSVVPQLQAPAVKAARRGSPHPAAPTHRTPPSHR